MRTAAAGAAAAAAEAAVAAMLVPAACLPGTKQSAASIPGRARAAGVSGRMCTLWWPAAGCGAAGLAEVG